jgi:hypothetical protein
VNSDFSQHALAAGKMLRKRKSWRRGAKKGTVILICRSEDQTSNSHVADKAA